MALHKTKLLHWSSAQIRLAELEKGLKTFKGKRPTKLSEALQLLSICHSDPELALEKFEDGDRLRRQYMRLLTEFPKFTAAALRCLNETRTRRVTRTSVIREFLLSERLG